MIGRWDDNATMGDTKATRAGATAAAPCTGRIYFPLCFVLSFRKNSFVRRLYPPRNSSSWNFVRRCFYFAPSRTFLRFVLNLSYKYPVVISFVHLFIIHGQHWTIMVTQSCIWGLPWVTLHLSTSSTCAGVFVRAARS